MDAERMHALEKAAADFDADNHKSYLKEALQALRDPALADDAAPVAALRLLVALQGSPFASRPDQAHALQRVGAWLESWLLARPDITRADLTQDIGWLARLCDVNRGRQRSRPEGAPAPFGRNLARLESLRRATPASTVGLPTTPVAGVERTPPTPAAAPPTVTLERQVARIQASNAAQEIPRLLSTLGEADQRALAEALVKKLKRKWFAERASKGVPWASTVLTLAK